MPVSATAARVSAAVPNALSLDQNGINQVIAGAKAVNINHLTITVPWNAVQTSSTFWNFTATDRAVNSATNAGMGVTIILDGPRPSWSKNPLDPVQFATFATNIASRYRKVTEFQVWNYPNISDYWPPAPDGPEYTDLLKAVYPALKKVNPSIKVIFGLLQAAVPSKARAVVSKVGRGSNVRTSAPTELSPVQFLTACYTAGAKSYFDIMAYAPLSLSVVQLSTRAPAPSGNSIKQADDVRALMSQRGDSAKKVYWTFGYDTDTNKFTQLQQSLYLDTMRWLAETRKDHVTGLTIYTYRDEN